MAMRHMVNQPLAYGGASVLTCHIGLGPSLIKEDQALGVDPLHLLTPFLTPLLYVLSLLLGGVDDLLF